MKNKDLQKILQQYPPEMEVLLSEFGTYWTLFEVAPESLTENDRIYNDRDGNIKPHTDFKNDVLIIS
jgi:hypothetical protein